MARRYTEVSKRAVNSVTIQLKKLILKYGEKDVRLVINKFFEKEKRQKKLEAEIEKREIELKKLKSRTKF